MIVAVEIESASAKIRTGPAKDEEEDYTLPVWAGVMPMSVKFGEPMRDERLSDSVDLPEYLKNYRR